MSAVASGLSFEVLRFTVEPVSSEVALLELEGRFRAEKVSIFWSEKGPSRGPFFHACRPRGNSLGHAKVREPV